MSTTSCDIRNIQFFGYEIATIPIFAGLFVHMTMPLTSAAVLFLTRTKSQVAGDPVGQQKAGKALRETE
jgi:hypothetical protein